MGYSWLLAKKQWRKDNLFNKWCWENWTVTCKGVNFDPYLTPHTINSKQIKDLNVRPETAKLLEENIVGKPLDICLGNDFLDMTLKGQATKTKIDKWDYVN